MKKYSVGDYYNDGVREGVVFEVSADGRHGKIVSMKQSTEGLQWATTERKFGLFTSEAGRLIGADSETDGAYNMAKVKAISGWETKYPAFKWCADLGEGWYLPSKKELHILYNSGIILRSKLADDIHDEYWSSTEPNGQSGDYFNAWVCSSWRYSHDSYSYRKYTEQFVRAVATFGEDILEDDIRVFVEMERKAQNKKYNIGDYYNDGVREGVVFEVSADGCHGKIVSMKQSAKGLLWSSDSAEQKRLIGADSETDGAVNMLKVQAISGWREKYPAFRWCADLGEGWYLPSKEELEIFTLNDAVHEAVNRTLSARGGTRLYGDGWYWSSTETNYKCSSGEFCAWCVTMNCRDSLDYPKYSGNYVRAVSAF